MFADEIIISKINDFISEYFNSLDENMEPFKEQLREEIIGRSGKYFGESLLANIKPIDLKLKTSDKGTGYIYFQNGYVEAQKNYNHKD